MLGGTTTTVQVSTFSQSEGVKVPGVGCALSVSWVTVVVMWGGTTTTVQVSKSSSQSVYVPGIGWRLVKRVTVVVTGGGTTTTVQVSTSSQFEGVKVPGVG